MRNYMKKPRGYSLIDFGIHNWVPAGRFGLARTGTLRPSVVEDGAVVTANNGGLRFGGVFGTLRRPIPKIYKLAFWKSKNVAKNRQAIIQITH